MAGGQRYTLRVSGLLATVYGVRRGEVCDLKWDRVDFERGTIRVEEAVVYAGSMPLVKETKTEAGMRTKPMISPVKVYLIKVKKMQREKQINRAVLGMTTDT